MQELAQQLSMHDVNTVWLACVGLTSLMLEERNSAAQYDRCVGMPVVVIIVTVIVVLRGDTYLFSGTPAVWRTVLMNLK